MICTQKERRVAKLKKKNRPFNAERCAERIIKVLKKHGANYWDVDNTLATVKNKLFSEKVSHKSDSGKYDGEIKIKTRVDNSEIDKTMKKLKKSSALAEGLAEKKKSI